MNKKKDEQEMKESMDETENKMTVKNSSSSLTVPDFGINIEGLQDVPVSVLPVPFVKLVQGTSTKIELEDGKDAPVGTFYFTDLQQAFEQLSFVLLRAKYQIKEFERDGEMVPTKQMLLLGITLDTQKLFILTLSVMSHSNFGRLVSKLKDRKTKHVWEYEVIATSEKMENKKGKFQVVNLQVGRKISDEEVEQMAKTYGEYGGVLDREYVEEEDVATE